MKPTAKKKAPRGYRWRKKGERIKIGDKQEDGEGGFTILSRNNHLMHPVQKHERIATPMPNPSRQRKKKLPQAALWTKPLPKSPTRDELMARLIRNMGQQILPDSEMRACGYSERAIRDMP